MNAINNGKIDGWPQNLKTTFVDSGSNVDINHEKQLVMKYLMESTGRSKEDCVAKLEELEFTQEMMDGTIGALSGGWQMKMRLVMAVLIDPDIYLLDEPTNHLSKSAVQWVTKYLQSLQNQTVLIVSHDTPFLENVCTDVIHYEERPSWAPYRRLVHYKAKMSEFVKLQPQAKHYFELATTDHVKYVFPQPGRLEGIRTSTQKFLEMENVDFKYETRERNTLTGINLKMTLSSRVVVLGANGAGKTTVGLTDWARKSRSLAIDSSHILVFLICPTLLVDQNDCWRDGSHQYRCVQVVHSSQLANRLRGATRLFSRGKTHGRVACGIPSMALQGRMGS